MNDDKFQVFVVDDDSSVRSSLKRLFKSVGLQAVTFDSAQEFLDSTRPNTPCCLILDIRMPGLSGLDLQQQLNERGLRMPIIFITGHGSIPMSVRAMKAGAVDFFEKPFHDQDLLDAVYKALDQEQRDLQEQAENERIQSHYSSLTSREQQVFQLVITGMLNKQIAYKLNISEKTVKAHRSQVMQKMEANSLADLVRMGEKLSDSLNE